MSKEKPVLIPAVGYLRKSTKEDGHEKSIADQKARIQEMKPAQEGASYDIIRWYADPGIPGWKRGHKRPDYFRLVNDLRERRDIKAVLAVLVDDMDRFSRADSMQTVADVQVLRELGVRYIHAANQGIRDLAGNVGMVTMQIGMEANASHEHCTRLSRRILSTRLAEALQGKLTGGTAPYGMEKDCYETTKKGKKAARSLKHGDPKEVRIVRWLFDQFGNNARSLNWLAGDLNARKVPGPTGGQWYVRTVADILRQRAYRGDAVFNMIPRGQFFRIDRKGEVREKAETNGDSKLIVREGVYKPLVDPALFDNVQRRLDLLKKQRSRRKSMYALSGILVCDHCGYGMYGTPQHGKGTTVVYRCGAIGRHGKGACSIVGAQVREDLLLPFLMEMLSEEMDSLEKMLTAPPDELRSPYKERVEQRERLKDERERLSGQIAKAEENLLFIDDPRTRKSLDARVSSMRDELDRLDAELVAGPPASGFSRKDLLALTEWWNKFYAEAVAMPMLTPKLQITDEATGKTWRQKLPITVTDPDSGVSRRLAIMVPARKVNEALHQLGCEVRLRWKTQEFTSKTGNHYKRYMPARGRFRLGQRNGKLPRSLLVAPHAYVSEGSV